MSAGAVTVLASAPGCKATGVGDPCVPEQEYLTSFNGFDEKEVNVESKSFQCQTRLCLVNHFRGRVSCRYGQDAQGASPPDVPADVEGANGCTVPGTTDQYIVGLVDDNGQPVDPKKAKEVRAQCADRTADKAVYCSCRCANVEGRTDDGANYCTCPDGFVCEQLVTSIGQGDTGLTGAYCIKAGTKYDPNNSCASECQPTAQPCTY